MSRRVVYLSGQCVPEAEARISIYDSGVAAGDMAFEVTRTVRHVPLRLDQHLARLGHSLSVLRIDPGLSADELREATLETLARNLPTEGADVDWNIIHNVSRGPAAVYRAGVPRDAWRPTVVISCLPIVEKLAALAPAFEQGIDLLVARQQALPGEWFDASIKTRSRLFYQLADLEVAERQRGATALLREPAGWLTETTSGNFFFVRGRRLYTPSLRSILHGVTREIVLELAQRGGIEALEGDFTAADAAQADEMFVTSTSIGLLHARSFEGRAVGQGTIGPLTRRLREAFDQEVGLSFAEQARSYALRTGQSMNQEGAATGKP